MELGNHVHPQAAAVDQHQTTSKDDYRVSRVSARAFSSFAYRFMLTVDEVVKLVKRLRWGRSGEGSNFEWICKESSPNSASSKHVRTYGEVNI